jgi:hypothetical protein
VGRGKGGNIVSSNKFNAVNSDQQQKKNKQNSSQEIEQIIPKILVGKHADPDNDCE